MRVRFFSSSLCETTKQNQFVTAFFLQTTTEKQTFTRKRKKNTHRNQNKNVSSLNQGKRKSETWCFLS